MIEQIGALYSMSTVMNFAIVRNLIIGVFRVVLRPTVHVVTVAMPDQKWGFLGGVGAKPPPPQSAPGCCDIREFIFSEQKI